MPNGLNTSGNRPLQISFRAGGQFELDQRTVLRIGIAIALVAFLVWRFDPADLIAIAEAILALVT